MKKIGFLPCVLLAVALGYASPQTNTSDTTQDQVKADETLQRYAAAYASKSYSLLLDVWPDLASQKKEAGKIKHHLDDVNLSGEQLTLQRQQMEASPDGALVQVHRTEKWVKTERSSTSTIGDLRGGSMPTQDPGPHQTEKKKTETKEDTVWIKMRRSDKDWTIVSISERKP